MTRLSLRSFSLFAVFLVLLTGCTETTTTRSTRTVAPSPTSLEQGVDHYEAGNFAAALAAFHDALKDEPDNGRVWNWLGWAYFKLGQLHEAKFQFNLANDIKEMGGNYHGLGETYLALHDYDNALKNYQAFDRLSPNDYLAANRLGWVYYHLRNFPQAIEYFTTSNKLQQNPGNFRGLGEVYAAMRDYERAQHFFQQYALMAPQEGYPHNRLGAVYYNLQKYENALAEFNLANGFKERAENYHGLGRSYCRVGNFIEVDKAYEKALTLAVDEEEKKLYRTSWGDCYVRGGNPEKAANILGQMAYLGIEVTPDAQGMYVARVTPGSPASTAGLRAGDILSSFNRKKLAGLSETTFYSGVVGKAPFGSIVRVHLMRGRAAYRKYLTIGLVPPTPEKSVAEVVVPVKAERWALLVGISKYKDSRIPELAAAATDAKALYDWMVAPDGGRYAPARVRLLQDEKATAAAIKDGLFNWLRSAVSTDIVTLYFVGHGSAAGGHINSSLYYLPFDATLQNIAASSLSLRDVDVAMERFIQARRIIVMTDVRHSGKLGKAAKQAGKKKKKSNAPGSSILKRLTEGGEGVCAISGSADTQLSQLSGGWGEKQGMFTRFLLKGLQGGADSDGDETISLGELTRYVVKEVSRASDNKQTPVVSGRFDRTLTLGY